MGIFGRFILAIYLIVGCSSVSSLYSIWNHLECGFSHEVYIWLANVIVELGDVLQAMHVTYYVVHKFT